MLEVDSQYKTLLFDPLSVLDVALACVPAGFFPFGDVSQKPDFRSPAYEAREDLTLFALTALFYPSMSQTS